MLIRLQTSTFLRPSKFFSRCQTTSAFRCFGSLRFSSSRDTEVGPSSHDVNPSAFKDRPRPYALFRSDSKDILENFAMENALLQKHDKLQSFLFLWLNKTVVTIGRHQNAWQECRLSALETDNVELVRRQSGGGAVLQDEGCLTFTLVTTKNEAVGMGNLKDFTKRNFHIVLEGLRRAGIENAKLKGRNDIVVPSGDGGGECKISGSAFKQVSLRDHATGQRVERYLHHGTLLFDTDFQRLGQYLTPSKVKLQSKGIKSVQSRVVNLKTIRPELTLEDLKSSIESAFLEKVRVEREATLNNLPLGVSHHRSTGMPHLDDSPHSDIPTLITKHSFFGDVQFNLFLDSMSDWSFRFGQSPEFSYKIGPHRLERGGFEALAAQTPLPAWGQFDVMLNVENGEVIEGQVFSDTLLPDVVTRLNLFLAPDCIQKKGLKYSSEAIKDYLTKAYKSEFGSLSTPDELAMCDDLLDWIAAEVKDV